MKDIKEIRKDGLDKFYTLEFYSKQCIDNVFKIYNKDTFDLIIEPSAGNGSFYNQIIHDNKIGIDIEPEDICIIKQDFLKYKPPLEMKNILVIGNPPFGKNNSLAIKFFNYASKFSNVIAFIIPRTFRKVSIQNKLNTNFHLIYDEDVPINKCFNVKIFVKCCFQIWQKKEYEREIIKLSTKCNDWEFLPLGEKDDNNQPTPPINADFAIRAYGGKIGKICVDNLEKLRPKSWHWIKITNVEKDELIKRFSCLDYSKSENTARQNSIGRGELIELYKNTIF